MTSNLLILAATNVLFPLNPVSAEILRKLAPENPSTHGFECRPHSDRPGLGICDSAGDAENVTDHRICEARFAIAHPFRSVRRSRLASLRVVRTKSAKVVRKAMTKGLKRHSGHPVRTITTDNGKEFAEHEQLGASLNAKTYFANPYSSWERGSNENMNGLVRQYFPRASEH